MEFPLEPSKIPVTLLGRPLELSKIPVTLLASRTSGTEYSCRLRPKNIAIATPMKVLDNGLRSDPCSTPGEWK